MLDYEDVVVRIDHRVDDEFSLHFERGDRHASKKIHLRIAPERLERIRGHVTRSLRTRGLGSPALHEAEALGGELFEKLFAGEVGDIYRSALDDADAGRIGGVRLTLCLSEASELMSVPWEFLYDSLRKQFIVESVRSPIVRSLDQAAVRVRPSVAFPLKVLGLVSTAALDDSAPRLDIETEKEKLRSALAPLMEKGWIELTWVPDGTLEALQKAARQPFHIFHYVGHGGFDPMTNDGQLILETRNRGLPRPVTGERLSQVFVDADDLRLAVLNTCEGARVSPLDPFAGVATSLLKKSVPAVIAMQYEITDDAAIVFSEHLYGALAEREPVDRAVTWARKALAVMQGHDLEFGTPVLFLQTRDGWLFPDESVSPVQAVIVEESAPTPTPRPAQTTLPNEAPDIPDHPEAAPAPATPPTRRKSQAPSRTVATENSKPPQADQRQSDGAAAPRPRPKGRNRRGPTADPVEVSDQLVTTADSANERPPPKSKSVSAEGPIGTSTVSMPGLGQGVREAVLVRWLKRAGDAVREDDPLFEVSTKGGPSTLLSPFDGDVMELLADEGSAVPIGAPLARIVLVAPQEGPEGTSTVTMPGLGRGVPRGTVVCWKKKSGQWVREDEPLFEVSTGMETSTFLSPFDGKLVEIIVGVGATVKVKTPLARIATSVRRPPRTPEQRDPPPPPKAKSPATTKPKAKHNSKRNEETPTSLFVQREVSFKHPARPVAANVEALLSYSFSLYRQSLAFMERARRVVYGDDKPRWETRAGKRHFIVGIRGVTHDVLVEPAGPLLSQSSVVTWKAQPSTHVSLYEEGRALTPQRVASEVDGFLEVLRTRISHLP